MALSEMVRGMVVMVVKDPFVADNASIRSLSIAQALTRQGFQVALVIDRKGATKARPNERMADAWKAVTADRADLLNGVNNAGKERQHYFVVNRPEGTSVPQALTQLLPARRHRSMVAGVIVSYPAGRDVLDGARLVLGENTRIVADCASLDELNQYAMGATFDAYGVRTSNPAHDMLDPGYLIQFDRAAFASRRSLTQAEAALKDVASARAGQPQYLRALQQADGSLALDEIPRVSKMRDVTGGLDKDHSRLDAAVTAAVGVRFVAELSNGEIGRNVERGAADNVSAPRAADYTLTA